MHRGMTSKAKDTKISNTITIHEQLSEVSMYPNVHDEDPHPQQIHDTGINVLGKAEFKARHIEKFADRAKLSNDIDIVNPRQDSKEPDKVFKMTYPEPYPWFKHCAVRYCKFFNEASSMFTQDKEVIVCLSHGNAVNAVAKLLGHDLDKNGIYSIYYGSTSILRCDGEGKWTLIGNYSHSEHLGLPNGEIIPEDY